MKNSRSRLPQLDGGLFLTDGGIETTLIYQEGFDLPCFAAFHLLRSEQGIAALRRVLHAPRFDRARARRGSSCWKRHLAGQRRLGGVRLGYSARELAAANRAAIDLLHDLRSELEADRSPMVISGCVGPRGDGYRPEAVMTPAAARAYHAARSGSSRLPAPTWPPRSR